MPTTILIADALRLFSDALSRALAQDRSLKVIADLPESGQDFLKAMDEHRPDVVLLDYWLAGMDAPTTIRLALSASPSSKIILLSWLIGTDQIQLGLEAGAAAFIPKTIDVDELTKAIQRARSGEVPVEEAKLDRMIVALEKRSFEDEEAWEGLSTLTYREIQILDLLNRGLLVEDVAKELGVKPSTVRKHIHHALEKTGAFTYAQAITIARRHGIIGP
ncbi:MAG: response regulator [Actinomycetota bacterium]